MKKSLLLQRIISHLAAELELFSTAARDTHADATDEQNKSEDKYDTRGLEASYLALGQSRQAVEVEQALRQFEILPARDFGPADPIDVGALVALEAGSEKTFYFVGPRAGGTEVKYDRKVVLVVTPQSPLGRQLVGKRQGDLLQIEMAGRKNDYRVALVA
ncbi:MAG: GreA/GreB family elongation factor [Opitutaceae bacterium]|nr:GreA/GreB family elongation factor [Opitutaceae bacterium]